MENKASQAKKNIKKIVTPEMALNSFNSKFLTEEVCAEFVLRIVHNDVAECPECKSPLTIHQSNRFWSGKKIKCNNCGKRFSGSTGTFFYNRFSSYRDLYFLLVLIALDVFTIQQISKYTGINRKTVGEWVKYFKFVSSDVEAV